MEYTSDEKEIISLLKKFGAERPDYTYPEGECDEDGVALYFKDGEPSCLFGHVLAEMGYGPDSVVENNTILSVFRQLGVNVSEKMFLVVQDMQDSGETWGDVVDFLEDELNGLERV